MIDKKVILIIIMGMIILTGVSVFAYNKIQETAYQEGIQDATLLINQQIINSLTQNGYVPLVYVMGNETQIINLVPYQGD